MSPAPTAPPPMSLDVDQWVVEAWQLYDSMAFGLFKDTANSADAFRHAYVSGRMALRYGSKIANFLGASYEIKNRNYYPQANMDLYNNAKGREIALRCGIVNKLAKEIIRAMLYGELILDPADPRRAEARFLKDPLSWWVIRRARNYRGKEEYATVLVGP